MKTALVSAIGSFSADAVIKSLKEHGLFVLGCDIFPKEWVVNAYSVDMFFQVPRGTDRELYINTIKEICTREQVDYLIPLTDAEIDTLNDNREWFQNSGVQLCISSKQTINICRNKVRTYEALEAIKDSIFSQTIPTISAVDYTEEFFSGFSLVCKPYNGRSSQGMRKLQSRKEVKAYLDEIDQENYILQPQIVGSIVTVDVVRNPETGKIICVPRKELLRTLSGAGTSVYIFHDDVLVEDCRRIADRLGIRGCVNFEFIQSADGSYHFLECNPRFSGGIEFSCLTGYDFIWAHLNCFSGKEIDDLKSYRNCYIARKYEEKITAME